MNCTIVPGELFELPALESVSLSKNCFTGSLPTTLCGASSLTMLDFDGLRSSDDCIRTTAFFQWLAISLDTAQIYQSLYTRGELLPCLFNSSALQALYLSGNGISGAIPDISPESALNTISLSHNRLHGSIPLSIQKWKDMIYLDLSYNRLSGTSK